PFFAEDADHGLVWRFGFLMRWPGGVLNKDMGVGDNQARWGVGDRPQSIAPAESRTSGRTEHGTLQVRVDISIGDGRIGPFLTLHRPGLSGVINLMQIRNARSALGGP